MECGICYSYRMELEIPDEVCSDTRCGQAFHRSCLYEVCYSFICKCKLVHYNIA